MNNFGARGGQGGTGGGYGVSAALGGAQQAPQNGGGYGGAGGAGGYGRVDYRDPNAERVIQKIRDALSKRGDRTLRSLGKAFKIMDNGKGDRKIDATEFAISMREFNVNLNPQEINIAIAYMDRDQSGAIDYDELLYAIRGRPNKPRQDCIDRCFLAIDRDNSGVIDRNDLMYLKVLNQRQVYDFTKHPKYNNGKSAAQIQDEFLENFGDTNKDGKITKQEWDDYYSTVSASIDNDEHFIMLMERAWKLKK